MPNMQSEPSGLVVLDISPPLRQRPGLRRLSALRSLKRKSRIISAALAIVVGGVFMTAAPASASTDVKIDIAAACRSQWGPTVVNSAVNLFDNPYGWKCGMSSVSIPWGWSFTPIGGVDLNGYCIRTYPNGSAVLVAYNADGWRCRY